MDILSLARVSLKSHVSSLSVIPKNSREGRFVWPNYIQSLTTTSFYIQSLALSSLFTQGNLKTVYVELSVMEQLSLQKG
jgi:hypothetical protein